MSSVPHRGALGATDTVANSPSTCTGPAVRPPGGSYPIGSCHRFREIRGPSARLQCHHPRRQSGVLLLRTSPRLSADCFDFTSNKSYSFHMLHNHYPFIEPALHVRCTNSTGVPGVQYILVCFCTPRGQFILAQDARAPATDWKSVSPGTIWSSCIVIVFRLSTMIVVLSPKLAEANLIFLWCSVVLIFFPFCGNTIPHDCSLLHFPLCLFCSGCLHSSSHSDSLRPGAFTVSVACLTS